MNDGNKLNVRIGDLVEIDMWNDLEQGLVIDKIGSSITIHQSNHDSLITLHLKFVTRVVLCREAITDFWHYLG